MNPDLVLHWFSCCKAPNTTIAEFANTVDPDETAHNDLVFDFST